MKNQQEVSEDIIDNAKKILNRSKDIFKKKLPNAKEIDLRNSIKAEKDFIKEKESE